MTKLIESKKIKPVVTRILSLAEPGKAQQQAVTLHPRGEIVLRIADEPKD